jgi:hypothetical protein
MKDHQNKGVEKWAIRKYVKKKVDFTGRRAR